MDISNIHKHTNSNNILAIRKWPEYCISYFVLDLFNLQINKKTDKENTTNNCESESIKNHYIITVIILVDAFDQKKWERERENFDRISKKENWEKINYKWLESSRS